MKSHLTKLIETLETMANIVTPNNGFTPLTKLGGSEQMNYSATVVDLAYRIGRALSHARAIANKR
jgi:hypothetical protein